MILNKWFKFMIYIGSDHGGYNLKEDLKKFLKRKGIAFKDVGPKKYNPKDDYPEFAKAVARNIRKDLKHNKGILLCRSGQGVCVVANKFKGIRAALSWNELVAKASRRDDDANILCLPSDYMSEELAQDVVTAWLNEKFSFEQRHLRRLKEIEGLK